MLIVSEMNTMKILQINVVYRTGSTGKIVEVIHKSLIADKYESYVIYGRGKKVKFHNVMKVAPEGVIKLQSARSKITGFAFSGAIISTILLIKQIKKIMPDIVHLHVLNGYFVNIYKLMSFLKKQKIKTILTLHAEFMYTGGCGNSLDCIKWKTGCGNCPQKKLGLPSSKIFDHSAKQWKLMKESFESFDDITITTVSDWLTTRAKQAPILNGNEVVTVMNGIDTTVFKVQNFSDIASKHFITNERIILHVTPDFTNPFKGGNDVIAIAQRLVNYNIKIIIIGFNGDQTSLPLNIITVKHSHDQIELAKYYSLADVTILTSKTETFSMVCAESLSCGTPVVGYKAGGPESITLHDFSEFVEQGNLDELENAVKKWLFIKDISRDKVSKIAREKYSSIKMTKEYIKIYQNLQKKGGI